MVNIKKYNYIIFFVCLFLASCDYNVMNKSYRATSYDVQINPQIDYDSTGGSVHIITSNQYDADVNSSLSWKEVFRNLLQSYYLNYTGEYRLFFLLYDIDKDGIPELFISEQGDWKEHIDAVYKYSNGHYYPLKFGEGVTFSPHFFSASGLFVASRPDNKPGIITAWRGIGSGFGSNFFANIVMIVDNELLIKYRGEVIVDVTELLEINAKTNDFDIIEKHTSITINENEVSETEFSNLFSTYVEEWLRPILLNKDNITQYLY